MAIRIFLRSFVVLACVTSLISCTHSTRDVYEPKDVGKTTPTTTGQIAASRIVAVRGQTTDAGLAAGGVLGGTGAGMATDNGWAALVGAVLGAGLGYATERGVNTREGIEYVILLTDGRRIMLTQNRQGEEAPIANGTPVLVQLGGKYSRVFPDPAAAAPLAAHNAATLSVPGQQTTAPIRLQASPAPSVGDRLGDEAAQITPAPPL